MRRALGFGLATQGRHLMSFVGFCEGRSADRATADLAVEWATQAGRGSGDEVYQARKLDTVRIFARHLQALDPATEVPPGDVLSRRQGRVAPYLYSPQEIAALMSAAGDLAPAMRAMTWRTLIGLLAVTGMRQGEACRLKRDDVDLDAGTLVIADSKFGKSRQVFLHPSATVALRAYEQARNQAFPEPETASFLVNSRGRPLGGHNLPHTFAPLAAAAGIYYLRLTADAYPEVMARAQVRFGYVIPVSRPARAAQAAPGMQSLPRPAAHPDLLLPSVPPRTQPPGRARRAGQRAGRQAGGRGLCIGAQQHQPVHPVTVPRSPGGCARGPGWTLPPDLAQLSANGVQALRASRVRSMAVTISPVSAMPRATSAISAITAGP
jgi:integrase/recombinase XerD